MPEFTDEVENRTVVAGREAILSCHVQHLGSYKVSEARRQPVCWLRGWLAGVTLLIDR